MSQLLAVGPELAAFILTAPLLGGAQAQFEELPAQAVTGRVLVEQPDGDEVADDAVQRPLRQTGASTQFGEGEDVVVGGERPQHGDDLAEHRVGVHPVARRAGMHRRLALSFHVAQVRTPRSGRVTGARAGILDV